jgi:hypothetical protein
MTTNVLILCTYNSARSVLAEGMLNQLARWLGTASLARATARPFYAAFCRLTAAACNDAGALVVEERLH